jgi:hypothetical protein
MATEDMKPSPEPDALFTQLAEPFDPSEIKWRVTHTNRDRNRGAVIAFADPRAYTDRLNQLFTPTGWTRTYDVSTVSSVTRMKKDKLIQDGQGAGDLHANGYRAGLSRRQRRRLGR